MQRRRVVQHQVVGRATVDNEDNKDENGNDSVQLVNSGRVVDNFFGIILTNDYCRKSWSVQAVLQHHFHSHIII